MCGEPRSEWKECCRQTSRDGSVVLDASSKQLYTNLRLVGLTGMTNDDAIMAGTTRNSNRCGVPEPRQPSRLTDATATDRDPCVRCGAPSVWSPRATAFRWRGKSVSGAWKRRPRHRSAGPGSMAWSSPTSVGQTRIDGAVGTTRTPKVPTALVVSRTRPPSAGHRNVPMDLRCSRA